jgi:anaerobic selenocysteine-containing dehydrogenase
MRKYGAFLVKADVYLSHEQQLKGDELRDTHVDPRTKLVSRNGAAVGVEIDDTTYSGFPTRSRKLEFYSATLAEWGWPEYVIPTYIKSHVHQGSIDVAKNEMLLLPTFRLPTLIHSRSGNAKWLYEISHKNPVWVHPADAARLKVVTGDLVRVETAIGYFVDRVWITEGIRPGIVACSHHLGRWRLEEDSGGERWSTALVDLQQLQPGQWMMRQVHGVRTFASSDPDSSRIPWAEAGVHQNLVFPVQPDPVSGQHCWHQKVTVTKASSEDRYGDILVDTNRAHEEYRRWLKLTRPAPGPDNLRRPLWMARVYRPAPEAFYFGATKESP